MWMPGVLLIVLIFLNISEIKCFSCQEGTFAINPSGCQPCKQTCNLGKKLINRCNATTDNECVCLLPNQFQDVQFDSCKDCTTCSPGYYPEKPCTKDTVCMKCPVNRFSNRTNNVWQKCQSCTICKNYKKLCNETYDAICDNHIRSTPGSTLAVRRDERTSQGPTTKNDGGEGEQIDTKYIIVLVIISIFVVGLILIIWRRETIIKYCRGRNSYTVCRNSQLESLNTGLLLRHQPPGLLMELHKRLNPNAHKNWKDLAIKLGFSSIEIANFEVVREKSAEKMLDSWQTQTSSTVDYLHECLLSIGREDIAEFLRGNILGNGATAV